MRPARRILPLFIPHLGCPHNCVFCSQKHITGQRDPVTPERVVNELKALREPVDELAFYGGSFTALPLEAQREYLAAAYSFYRAGLVKELRVSTRPDAMEPLALEQLREYGVRTVELGAQSMDDQVLLVSGRGHRASDTVFAVSQLRDYGFQVILQMMTGLPGSSLESDYHTGERLASLCPNGVRIYPTVIIRDTPLYDLWKRGIYQEHTVSDAVEICSRLVPLFEGYGIPIIRLGLNPSDELSAGEAAGGAYDPALGEKVRSRIYLEKARGLLNASVHGTTVCFGVNKSDISQMIGQRRSNLMALQEEYDLTVAAVRAADVPRGILILMDAI